MPTDTINLALLPEAQKLIDLAMIGHDLSFVRTRCALFESHLAEVNHREPVSMTVLGEAITEQPMPDFRLDDMHVLDALMSAAVVKYGRVFAEGVRRPIARQWIQELPEGLQRSHQYFIGLRNRFVAHSVGQFEDCEVVATVEHADGELVDLRHLRSDPGTTLLIARREARELDALAMALTLRTSDAMRAESSTLAAFVRTVPLERLLQLRRQPTVPPTRGDESRPRHRPRRTS